MNPSKIPQHIHFDLYYDFILNDVWKKIFRIKQLV